MKRLCTDFNFPQPITEKPYNRYIRYIEQKAVSNCERSLSGAARYLRKVELNGRPDDGQILDVAVSVDDAWQKCYGFNSLNGMVFLISIDTGCVLDYVVKTKFCHECKANRNASEEWKSKHKTVCCVNHEGSSGAMEKEGSFEMFLGSIEKHNIQYTTYVGDGDPSSYGAVNEALEKKYGDQYQVEKEDCIGHIQK